MDQVPRQIPSHVDVYGDDSTVSWNNAKHDTSGMIAADVTVSTLREDVAWRVWQERAGDPGVRRAWSKQKAPNPTSQTLSTPIEHEGGTERHAKDGAKGRGQGKRNKAAGVQWLRCRARNDESWSGRCWACTTPVLGVCGMPLPCVASSFRAQACCFLPLIIIGSASLTDHEKVSCGRSTKSSVQSTGSFGAVSEFKVSDFRWKSHHIIFARLHRFAPPSAPLSSKAALSQSRERDLCRGLGGSGEETSGYLSSAGTRVILAQVLFSPFLFCNLMVCRW